MRSARTRRSTLVSVLATLALVAAACGGDDETAAGDTGDETTAEATDDADSDDSGEDDAGDGDTDWQSVLDAAREEGEVTIYHSQDPAIYETLGATLEEEYGITLNQVRELDSTMAQRLQTDQQAGNPTADVFVSATPQVISSHAEQGWVTPPVGPNFADAAYPDSLVSEDGAFEVSAFITALAWNTDAVPDGLDGFEDAISEEYAGAIGVIEPAASVIVDYWVWLEEAYGEEYVQQLADLEPRIYNSSLTLNEALVSGEISVSTYANPPGLVDSASDGAPVDFLVPDGVWGAHFYGEVLADAPHPNAAQVLANYMVSAEAQEVIADGIASARENVDSALTHVENTRYLDVELLTDEFVRTYQEDWAAMFQ